MNFEFILCNIILGKNAINLNFWTWIDFWNPEVFYLTEFALFSTFIYSSYKYGYKNIIDDIYNWLYLKPESVANTLVSLGLMMHYLHLPQEGWLDEFKRFEESTNFISQMRDLGGYQLVDCDPMWKYSSWNMNLGLAVDAWADLKLTGIDTPKFYNARVQTIIRYFNMEPYTLPKLKELRSKASSIFDVDYSIISGHKKIKYFRNSRVWDSWFGYQKFYKLSKITYPGFRDHPLWRSRVPYGSYLDYSPQGSIDWEVDLKQAAFEVFENEILPYSGLRYKPNHHLVILHGLYDGTNYRIHDSELNDLDANYIDVLNHQYKKFDRPYLKIDGYRLKNYPMRRPKVWRRRPVPNFKEEDRSLFFFANYDMPGVKFFFGVPTTNDQNFDRWDWQSFKRSQDYLVDNSYNKNYYENNITFNEKNYSKYFNSNELGTSKDNFYLFPMVKNLPLDKKILLLEKFKKNNHLSISNFNIGINNYDPTISNIFNFQPYNPKYVDNLTKKESNFINIVENPSVYTDKSNFTLNNYLFDKSESNLKNNKFNFIHNNKYQLGNLNIENNYNLFNKGYLDIRYSNLYNSAINNNDSLLEMNPGHRNGLLVDLKVNSINSDWWARWAWQRRLNVSSYMPINVKNNLNLKPSYNDLKLVLNGYSPFGEYSWSDQSLPRLGNYNSKLSSIPGLLDQNENILNPYNLSDGSVFSEEKEKFHHFDQNSEIFFNPVTKNIPIKGKLSSWSSAGGNWDNWDDSTTNFVSDLDEVMFLVDWSSHSTFIGPTSSFGISMPLKRLGFWKNKKYFEQLVDFDIIDKVSNNVFLFEGKDINKVALKRFTSDINNEGMFFWQGNWYRWLDIYNTPWKNITSKKELPAIETYSKDSDFIRLNKSDVREFYTNFLSLYKFFKPGTVIGKSLFADWQLADHFSKKFVGQVYLHLDNDPLGFGFEGKGPNGGNIYKAIWDFPEDYDYLRFISSSGWFNTWAVGSGIFDLNNQLVPLHFGYVSQKASKLLNKHVPWELGSQYYFNDILNKEYFEKALDYEYDLYNYYTLKDSDDFSKYKVWWHFFNNNDKLSLSGYYPHLDMYWNNNFRFFDLSNSPNLYKSFMFKENFFDNWNDKIKFTNTFPLSKKYIAGDQIYGREFFNIWNSEWLDESDFRLNKIFMKDDQTPKSFLNLDSAYSNNYSIEKSYPVVLPYSSNWLELANWWKGYQAVENLKLNYWKYMASNYLYLRDSYGEYAHKPKSSRYDSQGNLSKHYKSQYFANVIESRINSWTHMPNPLEKKEPFDVNDPIYIFSYNHNLIENRNWDPALFLWTKNNLLREVEDVKKQESNLSSYYHLDGWEKVNLNKDSLLSYNKLISNKSLHYPYSGNLKDFQNFYISEIFLNSTAKRSINHNWLISMLNLGFKPKDFHLPDTRFHLIEQPHALEIINAINFFWSEGIDLRSKFNMYKLMDKNIKGKLKKMALSSRREASFIPDLLNVSPKELAHMVNNRGKLTIDDVFNSLIDKLPPEKREDLYSFFLSPLYGNSYLNRDYRTSSFDIFNFEHGFKNLDYELIDMWSSRSYNFENELLWDSEYSNLRIDNLGSPFYNYWGASIFNKYRKEKYIPSKFYYGRPAGEHYIWDDVLNKKRAIIRNSDSYYIQGLGWVASNSAKWHNQDSLDLIHGGSVLKSRKWKSGSDIPGFIRDKLSGQQTYVPFNKGRLNYGKYDLEDHSGKGYRTSSFDKFYAAALRKHYRSKRIYSRLKRMHLYNNNAKRLNESNFYYSRLNQFQMPRFLESEIFNNRILRNNLFNDFSQEKRIGSVKKFIPFVDYESLLKNYISFVNNIQKFGTVNPKQQINFYVNNSLYKGPHILGGYNRDTYTPQSSSFENVSSYKSLNEYFNSTHLPNDKLRNLDNLNYTFKNNLTNDYVPYIHEGDKIRKVDNHLYFNKSNPSSYLQSVSSSLKEKWRNLNKKTNIEVNIGESWRDNSISSIHHNIYSKYYGVNNNIKSSNITDLNWYKWLKVERNSRLKTTNKLYVPDFVLFNNINKYDEFLYKKNLGYENLPLSYFDDYLELWKGNNIHKFTSHNNFKDIYNINVHDTLKDLSLECDISLEDDINMYESFKDIYDVNIFNNLESTSFEDSIIRYKNFLSSYKVKNNIPIDKLEDYDIRDITDDIDISDFDIEELKSFGIKLDKFSDVVKPYVISGSKKPIYTKLTQEAVLYELKEINYFYIETEREKMMREKRAQIIRQLAIDRARMAKEEEDRKKRAKEKARQEEIMHARRVEVTRREKEKIRERKRMDREAARRANSSTKDSDLSPFEQIMRNMRNYPPVDLPPELRGTDQLIRDAAYRVDPWLGGLMDFQSSDDIILVNPEYYNNLSDNDPEVDNNGDFNSNNPDNN